MKKLGFIFLLLTIGLAVFRIDLLSLWSIALGAALGLGLFIIIVPSKLEKSSDGSKEELLEWQVRFHDLESRSSESIEKLNKEIERVQRKWVCSEERCSSYQALIDVHQETIEKFKEENNRLGHQVIEKDRKLGELQCAHLQPDLFILPK